MKNKKSISLVIPLYNNEKTEVLQIKQCEQILKSFTHTYEILICDDKSTDNSSFLLKKYFMNNKNIHLLFHKKNEGIAKTIKELYKMARYEYIALFSVDGDWDPHDIKTLVRYAYAKNADIIIGKRKLHDYTIYRKTISFLYNTLPLLFFRVKTYDAGSIKIIRNTVLKEISIHSRSVFFEAELIIKATKNGFLVLPYPIHFKKIVKRKGSGGQIHIVLASFRDFLFLFFSKFSSKSWLVHQQR